MEPYPAEDFGLTYVCGLEIEEPTGINLIEYLEEHPSLELFYAPGARVGNMDPKKTERMLALHPILHINALEAEAMSQKTSYEDAAAYLHSITGNTVIVTLHRKRRDQLSDPVHSRRSCGGYHRSRRCPRGSHHRLPDQRPLPAGFHCICQPGIPDRGLRQGLFPSAGAPSAPSSLQKRPLG